jgi:hypothetical protein
MEWGRKIKPTRYRSRTEILSLAIGSVLVLGALAPATGQEESSVLVASRYNARVAHVETIGTLFDDSEEPGAGSGLLIGDNFILTNNHIIPAENKYRSLKIFVRLKSRSENPLSVRAYFRDDTRDLALLELASSVSNAGGNRCPMPVIRVPEDAPMGTHLYVMGFPLNQDLSMSGGMVSNQNAGGGRWQTDTVMNLGNSGGPAFNAKSALVGIAVGGITSFTVGGQTSKVNGVNFIIPTPKIVESPLYAKITQLPNNRRCWSDAPRTEIVTYGSTFIKMASQVFDKRGGLLATGEKVFTYSNRINLAHTFSETKEDHPFALSSHSKQYEKPFAAETGYSITSCSLQEESASHVSDQSCKVEDNGSKAVLRFRLESGPATDAWIGWWAGTVTLTQDRYF